MQPAPELRSAADAIVANLSAGVAAPTWDGLYLPLKLDARAARITGGDEVCPGRAMKAMPVCRCTSVCSFCITIMPDANRNQLS